GLRHRLLRPAGQRGTLERPARRGTHALRLVLQQQCQVANHLREVAGAERQVKGRREQAAALWAKSDDVPALFNRGMAALFQGKAAEALAPLRQAVARLPENSSWHHLGQLYLTLAEMRR